MINIVVAYANNRVIGHNGSVPWHLPSDLKFFKQITSNHTVVMGRKTFESIRQPLPNRRNIVLTHSNDFHFPGVEVMHNTQDVLALGDIFIIGGENIYRQFIDVTERLYITEIALEIEGDTFFPAWDQHAFTLISTQEGTLDENNRIPHTFSIYQRNKP